MGLKASDFPFSLDSYDPEAYYVHSTDRKGHREEVRVAVPPEILRCLEVMRESGKWPAYRTRADIVRDAIYHLIARRLREIDDPPRGSDTFWYALKEQELADLARRREAAQRLADTADREVRRLLEEGLVAEAREQVEEVLQMAQEASDRKESTWLQKALRARLSDVWDRLFGPAG